MRKTSFHLRRRLLHCAGALPLCAVAAALPSIASASTHITDVAGRRLSLPRSPRRIVLLEARDILSMALLHPQPAGLVVGWAGADGIDSVAVRRAYDHGIAVVGMLTPDTLSYESVLALKPDLVVGSAFMLPGLADNALARRLERAGIPLAFSSVWSNSNAPSSTGMRSADDLERTMRFWGDVLDRQHEAQRFIDFCMRQRARVAERLARPGPVKPVKTYLETVSSFEDCCWAAGTDIWGALLRAAGGAELSAARHAPWYTHLSTEQLITEKAEAYIATGGDFGGATRLPIGPGLELATAQRGLLRLTQRTGFQAMPAVVSGKVFGVWTGLITSVPLNTLFIEVVAKWLHPERFEDIDPADSLRELNATFMAQALPGPLWAAL